ncbi:hypothetical protein Tco_0371357 [Tanacetum coccineum]
MSSLFVMIMIWSTLLMMIQVGLLTVVLRVMLQHEKIIIHLTHQVTSVLLGWVILGYQGLLVLEIFACSLTRGLGHMSEKGMSILSKKNMLSGVHDINLKNCYHCLAGKQTRLAFKSRSPFRIENILDLVHSDVKRSRNLKQIRNRNFTEVYFLTVP